MIDFRIIGKRKEKERRWKRDKNKNNDKTEKKVINKVRTLAPWGRLKTTGQIFYIWRRWHHLDFSKMKMTNGWNPLKQRKLTYRPEKGKQQIFLISLSPLSCPWPGKPRLCATLKDVSVLKCIWRMEEVVRGVIIQDEQVDHLQSFTVPSGITEAWHTAGTYQAGREEDSLNNSLFSFISNYNKGLLWSHTGNAVTQLCDALLH